MTRLRLEPAVLLGHDAEVVKDPADEIFLREVGHGEVQVADYRSEDRDGPPAHSHAWDEVQIIVEGEAEFRIADADWVCGGSGTVQLLPQGVPHCIRVPEGLARIIQVSIGAPTTPSPGNGDRLSLRSSLDQIVEAAARHGVRLG